MKRFAILFALCVPLALLLMAGLLLTAIECGAGWLNDRCQKLFAELYEGTK